MKTFFALFIAMTCSLNAAVIEGTLIAKLQGELDPMVLGDGCLSIVEYYNGKTERFDTIGILELDEGTCISAETEVNEEVDFDLGQLAGVKSKSKLRVLRHLSQDILEVQKKIKFYEIQ